MIPTAEPYFPSKAKFFEYIDGIYDRRWLTNNGDLVKLLTERLKEYLGVDHLLLVANGTLALQVAYKALNINSEAVTTPYSFVATASSLKWGGITPVFADIDISSCNLDPAAAEAAITESTEAVVPVHVYGNPCEVEAFEALGRRRDVKIIYDAAHAFGVEYKGRSLLSYGDASTLSFHATKVFHSAEGGAIIFRKREDLVRAQNLINFGLTDAVTIEDIGINAKMSELHAAMGLCVLDEIEKNLQGRRGIWEAYSAALDGLFRQPSRMPEATNNFAYYPVFLRDEAQVLLAINALKENGIIARRYFYPSLDSLGWGGDCQLENSRYLAERVLCLPIYSAMLPTAAVEVSKILRSVVE